MPQETRKLYTIHIDWHRCCLMQFAWSATFNLAILEIPGKDHSRWVILWKQLIKAYLHGMWAHWGNSPDPCNTVSLLHPMAPHPRKQRCCSPKAYFPQAHVAGSASKSRNEKSSSVSTETWKRDSFVYLWTLRVHTHTHINHTNTHTHANMDEHGAHQWLVGSCHSCSFSRGAEETAESAVNSEDEKSRRLTAEVASCKACSAFHWHIWQKYWNGFGCDRILIVLKSFLS